MKFCGVFAISIIFIAFQVLETHSLDITEAKNKISKYVEAVDHVDGLKIFQDFFKRAKSDAEIINFAKNLDELESQRHFVQEAENSLHPESSPDHSIDATHVEPSPSGEVFDAGETIETPEEHESLHETPNIVADVSSEEHDSDLEIPSSQDHGTSLDVTESAATVEPIDLTDPTPDYETLHYGIDLGDQSDVHEHIDLGEPVSVDKKPSPNEVTVAPSDESANIPGISSDSGLLNNEASSSDSESDDDSETSSSDFELDDDSDEDVSDEDEGNNDSVDLEDNFEAVEKEVVSVPRELPPVVAQFLETRHIKCFRACMSKFKEGLIDLLHTRQQSNSVARATLKHLWVEFKNIVTDDVGSRTVEYVATHVRSNIENPLVQKTFLKITHAIDEIFSRGSGWEAVHLTTKYTQTIVNSEKRIMQLGTIFLNGYNAIKVTNTYNKVKIWAQKEFGVMMKKKREKEMQKQTEERMKQEAERKKKGNITGYPKNVARS